MSSVKVLAESPGLNSIPPNYAYFKNTQESTSSDPEISIPTIDFSLLTSGSPHVVQQLGKACEEWGFFMLINHGIPETLMKAIIDVSEEFFDLPEEEKIKYETKNVLDPIRFGTSFNSNKDEVFCWRDYLKIIVHPDFHFPQKPEFFSEILSDYCKRAREVVRKLIEGVSKSLGLEKCYVEKSLDLDSTLQIFVANYYPPCPQPELAMGIPPHSDHGLFTLLIQNRVGGLQIQHDGKWINVNSLPNSILINTGDQLEVFSNGKYKSVLHRAVVKQNKTRISLAVANGPSLDNIVRPAGKLLENEGSFPGYIPMKYREYLEDQQGNKLNAKACVDRVKIRCDYS